MKKTRNKKRMRKIFAGILISILFVSFHRLPDRWVAAAPAGTNIISPTRTEGEIKNGDYTLTRFTFKENELILTNTYYYVPGEVTTYYTIDTVWSKNQTGQNGIRKGYPEESGVNGVDWVRTGVRAEDREADAAKGSSVSQYTYTQENIKKMLTLFFGELKANTEYTVYMSEIFIKRQRHASGEDTLDYSRQYTNLDDIRNAAAWTESTRQQFEAYYDIPMTFFLAGGDIHVVCVDVDNPYMELVRESDSLVLGDSKNIIPKETIAYGEKNYIYAGKYNVSYSGIPLLDQSGGPGRVAMTEQGTLTVFLGYKLSETGASPTPTKKPENVTPGLTGTPIPTASIPTVPSGPTPTPQTPEMSMPSPGDRTDRYDRFYTTTEGHTLEQILLQEKAQYRNYWAASCNGLITGYSALNENDKLKKEKMYAIGIDADGNKWGFIMDNAKDEALEVHPLAYNGIELFSGNNISQIDKLVFPDCVKVGNRSYSVRSIGGSGYKYHQKKHFSDDIFESTPDGANYKSMNDIYEYDSYSGYYFWNLWTTQNTMRGYEILSSASRSLETKVSYWFGVAGTGAIETRGKIWAETQNYVSYSSETSEDLRSYNYYVYNTTLKEIYIPDSVTEILDYAFCYCQALERIEGGKNVEKIGSEAFMGVETVAAAIDKNNKNDGMYYRQTYAEYYPKMNTQKSVSVVNGNGKNVTEYYYNESKKTNDTDTEVMKNWKKQIQLCPVLEFPSPEQIPELSELGYRAFAFRDNLKNVILSENVSSLGKECFGYDRLPEIYVQNPKIVIGEHYQTLGTHGFLLPENDLRTVVYEEIPGKAGSYTERYSNWYQMNNKKKIELDSWGAEIHTDRVIEVQKGKMSRDIVPPIKYEYIFTGFFTEPEGQGKQYYDEEGRCIREWEEGAGTEVLYADWRPEAVSEIVPYSSKDMPVLEENFHVLLQKGGSEVQIYADDSNPSTGALTDVPPYFTDDVYAGSTKVYDGSIPSTEQVAVRGRTGAWMLEIMLKKKTGIKDSTVRVTVPYEILYQGEGGRKEYKTGNLIFEIAVPKYYSYWEIEEVMPYFPSGVTVNNAAFQNGSVFVATDGAGTKAPVTVNASHKAESPVAVNVTYWQIYKESYKNEADIDWDKIKTQCKNMATWCSNYANEPLVQNDRLVVDGITILNNDKKEKNGSYPDSAAAERVKSRIPDTDAAKTYQSGVQLNVLAENADYASLAQYTYVSEDGKKTIRTEPSETTVNKIKIHTPVVCVAGIEAKDAAEHQETKVPQNAVVLVIGGESGKTGFTAQIGNTGYHSSKEGYGERNYEKFVSELNGRKRNEICFPFDVWVDADASQKRENAVFLKKDTWYAIGTDKVRFWLADATDTGEYTVLARSVAANGSGQENLTEYRKNGSRTNYCAYDEILLYITGRLYNFCVTKVEGKGVWKGNEAKTFSVGLSGEKSLTDTLPLRNGVHPVMQSGGELLLGDRIYYTVDSAGFVGQNCILRVIPKFVYVTDEVRENVQIYYDRTTQQGTTLVKLGDEFTDVLLGKPDKTVKTWSGVFELPDTCYVAKEGVDVLEYQRKNGLSFQEDFWKTGGSLLLCFEIRLETENGKTLYYGAVSEKKVNNIWQKEAGTAIRTDKNGNNYRIEGGETAVIYSGLPDTKDFSVYGVY